MLKGGPFSSRQRGSTNVERMQEKQSGTDFISWQVESFMFPFHFFTYAFLGYQFTLQDKLTICPIGILPTACGGRTQVSMFHPHPTATLPSQRSSPLGAFLVGKVKEVVVRAGNETSYLWKTVEDDGSNWLWISISLPIPLYFPHCWVPSSGWSVLDCNSILSNRNSLL